mgnify:CR=1 FL=1
MTWEVGGKDMMADSRKGTEKIKSSLWRRPQNKQTQGARLQSHWVGDRGAGGCRAPNREMPGLMVASQCKSLEQI